MRANLISDKLRNQQHCSRIKNEKTDTDDYLLTINRPSPLPLISCVLFLIILSFMIILK